jgi:DNA (cytosine-5)-methyltransferase 1
MPGVNGLILSIFPGIDLLGRAFEEEGYCVVRGPDVLWGGDIRTFHPPAGVFEGVIGGPPCQAFSALRHLIKHNGHKPRFGNLIPEFERIAEEAWPSWFLMENVLDAPIPEVPGYAVHPHLVRDKWVGGVQPRPRRFSFGLRLDGQRMDDIYRWAELDIEWAALMQPDAGTLTALVDGRAGPTWEGRFTGKGHHRSIVADARRGSTGSRVRKEHHKGNGGVLPHVGRTLPIEDACEAMGLPRDFTKEMPFTMHGKRSVIGNGVPMAMGRAIAKAVRRASHARR